MTRLFADRRGVSAIETAIVFPIVLSVAIALIGCYDVLSAQRAVEYGLESALRYATVRSTTATPSSITSSFRTAASKLSPRVGSASTVVVTPSSGYVAGGTVQVAVGFTWTATVAGRLFPSVPMSRTASITLVN